MTAPFSDEGDRHAGCLIQRLRGPFPSTTSTEVLWLLSEAIDALLSAESELAKLREENARKVLWSPYCGEVDERERDRIREAPLYRHGDTVIVWANEGSLYMAGERIDAPPSPEKT